jgi:alginate O-acetyltransferase complex protein AlgI
MVFSSPAFIFGFLPVFLVLYFASPARWRNFVIFAASLLFYFIDAGALTLVLGGAIVFNHLVAQYFTRASSFARKIAFIIGVVANLVPLIYYKYWMFFVTSVNDAASIAGGNWHFEVQHILLPAGISFFTFHSVSYLIDVYNHKVKPASSLVDFGMYMANFPQLIAGPIVRYSEIVGVVRDRPVRLDQIQMGLFTFIVGLSKKIILADNVAIVADNIFSLPPGELGTGLAWLGTFAYALQIYFDFSGYSDMAIGLGRMMGFEFPQNFNQPYRSQSVTEFWRRWHMTLSRWFRDYLYIPLGGNRGGTFRTFVNLFVIFFLCGLWHGAAYGFIIWGVYHGFLLIVERVLMVRFDFQPSGWAGQAVTFILVMIGWVFFRAPSLTAALDHLAAMAGLHAVPVVTAAAPFQLLPDNITFLVIATVCAVFPVERLRSIGLPRFATASLQGLAALSLMTYSCVLIAANGFNPFIYFRF